MLNTLHKGLPKLGIALSDETQKKLCAFGEAVVEQNKVMNLTAITEPEQVAKLHLLDSVSLLSVMNMAGCRLRCRIPRCAPENCLPGNEADLA